MDEKLSFEPQNLRLTDAPTAFLSTLFPVPLRYVVGPLRLAQVDRRIVRTCGKPEPSAVVTSISNGYTIKTLGTHV